MRNSGRVGQALCAAVVLTATAAPPIAGADPKPADRCRVDVHAPVIDEAARSLPDSTDWRAPYTNEGSGNFNPCAILSGAVAIPDGATTAAPVHVLLFHEGTYVGTATQVPYRHVGIDTKKSTDDTVVVGVHWKVGDECDACMSGVANVRFRWDGDKVEQLDPMPAQAIAG